MRRTNGMARHIGVLLSWAILGIACDDTGGGGSAPDAGDALPAEVGRVDAGQPAEADVGASTVDAGVSDAGRTPPDGGQPDASPPEADGPCDPRIPEICALPWPSDRYLVEDAETETGFRLDYPDEALPANTLGNHVDGSPLGRMDGYSVGTAILLYFPALDWSALPTETDPAPSLTPDAPIRILEEGAEGWTPVPYWAEMDSTEPDPPERALLLVPARILRPGTRHLVVVDGLRDTDGELFAPRPIPASVDAVLGAAGVEAPPQLAFWFVTQSDAGAHGELLHMRDEGLRIVGEDGPELTFTEFEVNPPDAPSAIDIAGTMRIPDFTTRIGFRGYERLGLNLGEDGRPTQNGWREVPFWIVVPHAALTGDPQRLTQYGHGLLNSGNRVRSGHHREMAETHGLILFAADLYGFSHLDVQTAVAAAGDVSHFEGISDGVHQGLLEWVLLARAMARRFPGMPEVAERGIAVDEGPVVYYGESQGGIYGLTYVGLSPDVPRGHLGVPGINYSLMMPRSVDFDFYFVAASGAYRDSRERQLVLQIVQTRWSRSDPVSWVHRIHRSPVPGAAPKSVLFAPAKGDHQVANVTNEIAARTDPSIAVLADYGRPVWGLEETPYPHRGSGLVMYDYGNGWPPLGNTPPREGADPHNRPRQDAHHQRQLVHFLRTGEIIDVCGGDGCTPE